jgi:hypothetical protein
VHELTHIANGHIDYCNAKLGYAVLPEVVWVDGEDEPPITRQTLEMDADSGAVSAGIGTIRIKTSDPAMRPPAPWNQYYKDPESSLFDWSIAVSMFFRLFGDESFEQESVLTEGYPPFRVRQMMAISTATTYILEKWDKGMADISCLTTGKVLSDQNYFRTPIAIYLIDSTPYALLFFSNQMTTTVAPHRILSCGQSGRPENICDTPANGAACPVLGSGAGKLNIAKLEAGTVAVPTFPVGGSISFTVRVQVAANVPSGIITNTAMVTALAGITDSNTANNTKADTDVIQPGAPTAVQLISFTATGNATGGATLQWRTGYEADNLGFNVYRDERGKRIKLNPAQVAGSALLAGRRTILTAGNGYAWTDPQGTSGTAYWLEDVDINGVSTWRGPVYVSGGTTIGTKPGTRTLATRQAPLLSELNEAANQDTQQEWAASASELVQVNGLEIET